jgi:CBS domain-containing protein
MPETVGEIMQRDPVTVGRDTDVQTVIGVLRQHQLPGVPVVDGDGRCVGIITEEDMILRDDSADLHLPHHIDLLGGVIFLEPLKRFEERLRKAVASTAADLMTADPITVTEDRPIREAARVIAQRKHNRLPVVDGDGRLVGVVTRIDVLEALAS